MSSDFPFDIRHDPGPLRFPTSRILPGWGLLIPKV